MKNFTIVPNEMLYQSQLSIPARYLYCVLLMRCGKNDYCYPSQTNLATNLGITDRHVRTLLNELISGGLVKRERSGFNKANHYTVAKTLIVQRNGTSYQLGSAFPFHQGTTAPTNITYRKGKANKDMEKMRDYLIRKRILK